MAKLVKRKPIKLAVVELPFPSQIVAPFEVKVVPSSFTSSVLLVTWYVFVAALAGRIMTQPNITPKRTNIVKSFFNGHFSFQRWSKIVNS
jgi:hypothetical protein